MNEKKPMEGLPVRRTALKVIRQVTEEGAYASLALDNALKGSGFGNADRRLTSRLVYDTLDQLIYLDWALGHVMAKPDTDIKLKNILRLGACQILLEDKIPESAATNLCVQLCSELGMAGLRGVCNGILRNLIRRKNDLSVSENDETDLSASIRYSIPEWLWKKIRTDYGEEAKSIVSFRNINDGWTLRPNMTRMGDKDFSLLLEKKVWKTEKTDIPHAWKIYGAMDISRDADYLAGHFSIQSAGSILACLAIDAKRGQQILDCCAAPGGKSCYLAETMDGTGRIQAWDIHEHRVKLIESQAKRLGLENIRPMVRDATVYRDDLLETMDAVLLDAPCSGTGFLAQKPDIKLRINESNLRQLTDMQEKLLNTVCGYVKKGGTFVYSTCSILKEENENQASKFLNSHPEFEEIPFPDTVPERFRQLQKRGLQILEHRDGLEGFYLIRMRKKDD